MRRRPLAGWPLAGWLGGLCTALVAVTGGLKLWSLVAASRWLPQWDMAKYAVSAQRLLAALGDLDGWRFVVELHRLSVWPPAYPLLEMAAFSIFGLGYDVPRKLQVILWVAMVVLTWWAVRRLVDSEASPGRGDALGVVAASLIAMSPSIAAYATLNLLEIPGLLGLALALGCYLRAIDAEQTEAVDGEVRRRRWWRATWLSSLVLLLCKYNYGILWLVPLALAEARRRTGSWRRLAGWLRSLLQQVVWLRPWPIFVVFVLLLMLAVQVTGGFEIGASGLRMTSLGGPAQVLYVAFLLRALIARRRTIAAWRWLESRGAVDQQLVKCLVLPFAVWMVVPPHIKDFLAFLSNRSEGPPLGSWDWLQFYPRLVLELFGSWQLGVTIAAFALAGLVAASMGSDPRRRIVALAFLFAALTLFMHPYKQPRFAFTAAWWLVVLGVLGVLSLTSLTAILGKARRVGSTQLLCGVAAGVFLAALTVGFDPERVLAEHRRHAVDPSVARVLDLLTEPPAETLGTPAETLGTSGTSTTDGLVVLGTWNRLSPYLLEWHARLGAAEGRETGRPRTDFDLAHRDAQRLLEFLRTERPARIALLEQPAELESGTSDLFRAEFLVETAWLEPVRSWLLEAPEVHLEERRVLGGYSVVFFGFDGLGSSSESRKPLASSSAKAAS